MNILGLTGVKGSGKDTLAQYLIDVFGVKRIGFADELYQQVANEYATTVLALNRRETKESALPFLALKFCQDVRFVEVALQSITKSRALRKACLDAYQTGNVPAHASARRVKSILNAPRSPRWTLQLWGTEYRRKSKYGVDSYWLDIVAAAIAKEPTQTFVITDVRFRNEAELVKRLGGHLMRIRRPVLEEREAADRAMNGTAAHPSEVEMLTYPVPYEVVNEEGKPDSLLRGFDRLQLMPAHAKAA
jgi:hypothetical protein